MRNAGFALAKVATSAAACAGPDAPGIAVMVARGIAAA